MNQCPFRLRDEDGQIFDPPSYPLRPGLPEPPDSMRHLPIDERGYPVPFFVAWLRRKPDFRVAGQQAVQLCVDHDLCWVCGKPLKGERTFVIGPMCTVNRLSAEPPSHRDCARYRVRACPFLTKPHMTRREDALPEKINMGAGVSIRRNPGVMALWFAREFAIETYPEGPLWRFTSMPATVEWYTEGRRASRAEVQSSIDSGLPALQEAAAIDGSEAMLGRWLARSRQLLPARSACPVVSTP